MRRRGAGNLGVLPCLRSSQTAHSPDRNRCQLYSSPPNDIRVSFAIPTNTAEPGGETCIYTTTFDTPCGDPVASLARALPSLCSTSEFNTTILAQSSSYATTVSHTTNCDNFAAVVSIPKIIWSRSVDGDSIRRGARAIAVSVFAYASSCTISRDNQGRRETPRHAYCT